MKIRNAVFSDAEALANLLVSAWNETYKGILSDDFIAAQNYKRRLELFQTILSGKSAKKETVLACVERTGEICGFVSCARIEDAEYNGEIIALYVLCEYQHMGCGRLLFDAAVKTLRECGTSSLLLWTLAQNENACRFYRAMGGTPVREMRQKLGNSLCSFIAYGWKML